jgi:hypothetical protein
MQSCHPILEIPGVTSQQQGDELFHSTGEVRRVPTKYTDEIGIEAALWRWPKN